ncbi:hypothetical protein HDF14_000422 [Edaphobacter lichenicola]|jgi:hypothetical protein|uniref:Uncharacterized protein n=1 Tax=Tunturiibacter gelidiferens TaxID=3069689 RepID=A0A9X0U215_9BACT|nr:hypothetical protein [Edaphobacter lichenicola]
MSIPRTRLSFSTDTWAIVLSLALAVIVRVGLLKTVGW